MITVLHDPSNLFPIAGYWGSPLALAQVAPPAWTVIFGLTLPVVILLLALGIVFFIRQRTQANLQALAARLGFQIKEEFGELSFGTSHMLQGHYGGRAMRFFNYQVLGEKNRPWLAVAATSRIPDGASLQVAPNRWYIRAAFLTRRLSATWEGNKRVNGADTPRLQSAKTRDPAFDDAFVVRTTDPNWAKKMLPPKVRHALLATRETAGAPTRLSMEGDEVRYSICGKFNQPHRVDHLVSQMDFVCGLATQVEASIPQTVNSPSSDQAMQQQSPSVAEPRKRSYLFPIIFAVVSVLSFLLSEVVPLFEKKFASSQVKPSAPMQILFDASHHWIYWWWLLFLIGFGLMKLSKRATAKPNPPLAEYEN